MTRTASLTRSSAPPPSTTRAPPCAQSFIAEAVGTIFSKPDVSDHELFKKAGVTGWSADVVPRSQRGKLVARISTFNQTLRETLDKAKA